MFASVHSLPFTHTLTCMHVHIKMLRDAEQAAVPIRLTAKGAQTHELSFVAHSLCRGSEQKKLETAFGSCAPYTRQLCR